MSQSYYKNFSQQVSQLKPQIAIVLGSGAAALVEQLQLSAQINFSQLQWPGCSVAGHSGQLSLGHLHEVPVLMFQGRMHWYEGHSAELMRQPMMLAHELGCNTVLLTNASGTLQTQWQPGQIVMIKDHINFQGQSPLVGLPKGTASPFIDMGSAYDPALIELMLSVSQSQGIPLPQGTYCAALGPQFETPSEIRMFKQWGADLIGMSTVSEVIMARYLGMSVLALSLVTNLAAGLSDVPLSHEQTLAGAQSGMRHLQSLIGGFVQQYAHKGQAIS